MLTNPSNREPGPKKNLEYGDCIQTTVTRTLAPRKAQAIDSALGFPSPQRARCPMRPTHTLSVLFRLFLSVPMFIGVPDNCDIQQFDLCHSSALQSRRPYSAQYSSRGAFPERFVAELFTAQYRDRTGALDFATRLTGIKHRL